MNTSPHKTKPIASLLAFTLLLSLSAACLDASAAKRKVLAELFTTSG